MAAAPYTLEEFAQADLHDVLDRLSLQEKVSLLAGPDWWTTVPIERVGVPRIKMSDGPNGVRGSSHFLPTPAQCIPCATALGATFDPEALQRMGAVLAREAKAKGSSLVLGPTINIQRNPLNGRAYESFSEDPLLSGNLAAAYVQGLQANGVGATVKHFVGNDQEDERMSVDVRIPERALREIYLKPFELAQKHAQPWSFMTSYSRLNGVHAAESQELLQQILRDEWKFDGLVMSDWFGTYSTTEAVNAGLDLEMPGPTRWRGQLLLHSTVAGKVAPETIDARAYAVLQAIQRSCQADIEVVRNNRDKERTHDSAQDRATCREVTSESIVLLKNDQQVLPLRKETLKKLAVLGPNAKARTVSGGGSAYLTSSYVITPYEGIKSALAGSEVELAYKAGCYAHRYLPMLDGWIKTKDGNSGKWTSTFYNSAPQDGAQPIAEHDLLGTRIRINDEKPKGLADQFYMNLEGYVTAEETGDFEFGISLVGRARVFIDEKLVIDNGFDKKQTRGASFYGLGTIEETGIVPFTAGQTYKITVEYTNVPKQSTAADEVKGGKQPPLMMAALRVGGAYKLDDKGGIEEAVQLAKESDAVVVVIGTTMDWEAEAADRESLALPGHTDLLVSRILEVNPAAVIVNQSGSAVTFPWVKQASTVVQAWFGGNEIGNAIADVLFGKVNPSGRMSLSFPYRIEDCTAHLNWGAESDAVLYGEGIFCFTEWSSLSSSVKAAADALVEVTITVRNTGSVAGRDVVQLYVAPPPPSPISSERYRRPARELKAFKKTRVLSPGDSEQVSFSLDKAAFAYWRDSLVGKGWIVDEGSYTIFAAKDSVDTGLATKVQLQKVGPWRGLC
ncbi:hypothetical protein Rhopal_001999-T1 [Rhodotorula paludigena]|uniref:beta-glucosidase n=1 Tax=Rhodotorula paludigena TaxID=86838 RepID=A0AAV5GHP5_9BASI|nr:hypothetical protein Rhopal_001999-T1 [Rhodotorula paludigena]